MDVRNRTDRRLDLIKALVLLSEENKPFSLLHVRKRQRAATEEVTSSSVVL